MSHFCHRCSATIADDAPFCSQCGAPQIRVVTENAKTYEQQANELDPSGAVSGQQESSRSTDWRLGFSAAVKAGALMAVVATVPPFIVLGFLWLPLGGALSVILYLRRTGTLLLSAGVGARLGALAGLLGFAMYGVLQAAYLSLMRFVFHQNDLLRAMFVQAVDQAAQRNPDPTAQSLLAFFKTPQGIATMVAVGMGMILLAFVLFASLGGLLATRVLGNKRGHRL